MKTYHDVVAILALIQPDTPQHAAALALLDRYRESGLTALRRGAGSLDDVVDLVGQLRENLLHELCALVDPAALDTPRANPDQMSPYI